MLYGKIDMEYIIQKNKDNITYRFIFAPHGVNCVAQQDLNEICKCKIDVSEDNVWTISAWYTNEQYKGQGFGKKTLHETLSQIHKVMGHPKKIEYIWNGTNQYVFDWLQTHFEPVCKLPIAVQKYMEADSWEAHVYTLNKHKVLKYFHVNASAG